MVQRKQRYCGEALQRIQMSETVLITGSARGLGKELALVFGDHGYGVILHDRKKSDLGELQKNITKKGVLCKVVAGDLKLAKTLDALGKAAKEYDVSVLINNAGVHCPKLPLEEMRDSNIDDLLGTNLLAAMKLTRRVYPFFTKKNKGAIITMNSLSGLENHRLRTIYGASKWGLRGFTDTLRLEATEHGIRMLDVYPSRIKTNPRFTEGMEPEEVAQKIYKIYKNTKRNTLILDDRPKKHGT